MYLLLMLLACRPLYSSMGVFSCRSDGWLVLQQLTGLTELVIGGGEECWQPDDADLQVWHGIECLVSCIECANSWTRSNERPAGFSARLEDRTVLHLAAALSQESS